jgi:hypothetical protein
VAVIAYRVGYVRGQDELLERPPSSAAERNEPGIAAVLPRWRRLTGWAAYGFAGLLNCLFLVLSFLYAKRWGWAVSLAAWALWFALFIGAIWLGEWCWQPYREAQGRLRQKQTEILSTRGARQGGGSGMIAAMYARLCFLTFSPGIPLSTFDPFSKACAT